MAAGRVLRTLPARAVAQIRRRPLRALVAFSAAVALVVHTGADPATALQVGLTLTDLAAGWL